MLREKELNLNPRIYKVDFIENVNGMIEYHEKYYKADSTNDATHKWLSEYQNNVCMKIVRCVEVLVQWN